MNNLPENSSPSDLLTEPRYLLAEKQLASIPFWEPKKKGGKERSGVKVVSFTSMLQGEPVKLTLKVLAGGDYGFPNTTDLEFFRAFEQILTERLNQQGELNNPIAVTGREMLEAVDRVAGGTGYRELRRFFGKLHALAFEVERTQGHHYKTGRFHLFHAMYHEGEKREDGSVTEMNEIEVAPWYLKSLQAGNCLVIDHALFQRLSLSLSKLLHQFLHAQFHFHQGVASEWYADVANNWQMKEYSALSRIKQQLDPSHEELKRVGFLESWDYIPFKKSGKNAYQIRWKAGPQWVAMEQVQKAEFGFNVIQPSDQMLFLEAKQDQTEAGADPEGTLVSILEVVGSTDRKYLPFWKQVVRDLPRSVVYKALGDIRERLLKGERIKNKGSYLVTLMKLEAKKHDLPWAMKD